MKKYSLILFLFYSLYCQDILDNQNSSNDNLFITDYEYGQMLYKNPRGIGCIKCHGTNGKKKFIAKYTHKRIEHKIYAPDITNLTLKNFYKKLKSSTNTRSIMPTYFLTDDEIKSIYNYIMSKN